MKQKSNMYEWAKPWNPLGGECPHKCTYCSTNNLRRFPGVDYKYSGQLRLFSDLNKLPKGDHKIIFVAGQNDLFANKVRKDDIMRVITECKYHPQHIYFFQTKNPARFHEFLFDFPKESILCTTIETNRYYPQMGFAPLTSQRTEAMAKIEAITKQVTCEPLFDFDLPEMIELIRQCNPVQCNIGFDSKHNHLPEPSKEKTIGFD